MRIIVLVLALLALPGAAFAQGSARKAALIIANGAYAETTQLANPINDASLIADSAKRAGFDVTLVKDLSQAGFQRALRDFRAKADGAQVAMVYYAGHGIEGSGKNWLIPVDAQLKSDLDLPYEAIDLDRVMEAISGAQVRMVVLDACRNNPFGRSWRSTSRAVQRGLAELQIDDVLVIYAAAPGQTAADGEGANSPFATSLAKRLVEPDLPIQLLGGAVRDDVLTATGGGQRPFVSASITGTPIYLVPRAAVAQAVTPVQQAQPAIDAATLDALGWQGALGAQSIAGFEEYKRQFPSGRFVNLADQNIARLRASQNGPSTSAPASTSVPVAASPALQARLEARRKKPSEADATAGILAGFGGMLGVAAAPALIIPDSSTRRLTAAEVAPLETAQLTLARNEIFARHGYRFNKPVYQQYFARFPWYKPTGKNVTLNPIEQANVQLLLKAERAKGGAAAED